MAARQASVRAYCQTQTKRRANASSQPAIESLVSGCLKVSVDPTFRRRFALLYPALKGSHEAFAPSFLCWVCVWRSERIDTCLAAISRTYASAYIAGKSTRSPACRQPVVACTATFSRSGENMKISLHKQIWSAKLWHRSLRLFRCPG
jgi:hypothetical protein